MVNRPRGKDGTGAAAPGGSDEDRKVLAEAPLLARLSLTRPIFVTSVVLLTLFVGLLSYLKLGVDLFPKVEIPVVSVQVPYRGAGPAEIETLVVKPIEDELATLAGVKRILSTCDDGSGTVTCQFYDGTDMKNAEQQVRNRVQNIRNKLPKEIDEPVILRVNLSDQPIMQVGLEADLPPAELFDLADRRLRDRFSQVPGVGKVDLLGGRKREIQVLLDRGALKRRALSASMVVARIADSSMNIPVGKVTLGGRDLTFRTLGEYHSLTRIADTVVAFTDRPVRVRDVGRVVDTLEDARSLAYVDGRPAIVFNIYKQTGANTVKVADGVRAVVEAMNAGLVGAPGRPVLRPLQDGSVWIRQNVEDVRETIVIGILLVLVVVYFFLGNFRSTLITSLALPNSLVGAFLLMHLAGFTINIMTLLALSLSVGLLIDDAIVVRENIFRHIEHGESPWRAALLGTKEVNLAVIATSAVVIAVFLPVGFLAGTVGKFLSQFGLTMCFAMVISLFDAITIAPMLSAFFAGRGDGRRARAGSFHWGGAAAGLLAVGAVGLVVAGGGPARAAMALAGLVLGGLAPGLVGAFDALQARLEEAYVRLIRWVVDHRGRTVLAAAAVFFGSFVAARGVTNTFIPQSDNPEFAVGTEMPVGTSLERTARVALQVEAEVRARREVRVTSVTVQENKSNMYVGMVPAGRRTLSSEDLKTLLRRRLQRDFPGVRITVGDFDPTAQGQKPFTLILKGDDLDALSAYAATLKAAMAKAIPGLVDLDTNYRPGKPEFQVRFDPQRAGRLGVGTVPAGQELRDQVDGAVAGKYRVGGREYDIRVRLRPGQRDLDAAFGRTWVPNLNGNLVRLSSVADGVLSSGPSSITRRDRSRSIVIDADLGQGAGLGDVLDATRRVIAAHPLPKGVTYEFVGQAEDFADMGRNMAIAFLLAIVMMYLVLASLYESFITPLTILLALPLAIAGAFYALFAVGTLDRLGVLAFLHRIHLFHVANLDASINLFSLIGMVMLLGLVAKNSILLVDLTLQNIAAGLDRREALVAAGRARLRPILMTSLALLFGTLPLALALNEAGRFRSSMGIAIAGGLFTSTLLTLVVVPAAFEYVDDLRAWIEGGVRRLGGRGAP